METIGSEARVEERLLQVLRDFLAELGGRGQLGYSLGPQASLERDLGLGSLEKVELLSRLEGEFHVNLSDVAMSAADTVDDVLRLVLAAEGRSVTDDFPAPLPAIARPLSTPEAVTNLVEALYLHCQSDPQRPHIFLRHDDGSEQTITYGDLANRACGVRADLEGRGVGAGDRVALMLPGGEDFFYSFIGVLLAQAIPVPIYPPFRADRIEEFAARQTAILRNAEPLFLIASQRIEVLARMLRPAVPSLSEVIRPERMRGGEEIDWRGVLPGGERPALIQYTSGSTGDPKGVLLTHANLLANIRAIGKAAGVCPSDSVVCWLPLYHDMGLIGCWLLSLYFGLPITILSPAAFLSRPERWLWAIHYHRATLSPAPNFAYDLCARRIRDESIAGLDLSCWRLALNGSESVLPETIDRFTSRYSRYGFRAETMLPVYGLAESTVALSFPPLGRPPRRERVRRDTFEREGRAQPEAGNQPALTFVSVGAPLEGHQIRIVDEADRLVEERVQGRIEFRGPSSMREYFRQPEATAAIRHGEWLDSGDLGYEAGGELFITGRSKDIILKAGRNLYPLEIETAVGELEGVRKGCVAAFGIADPAHGTEKLVVVAETRQERSVGPPHQEKLDPDKLRREIHQRLLELLGLPADDIVLLAPGMLPKTSSGKLQRAACRQAYQRGSLGRRRPAAALQWLRLGARSGAQRITQAARAVGRLLYTAYFWMVFVILLVACWLTMLPAPSGRRSAGVLRFFTRLFLRLVFLKASVDGLDQLPEGPLMLVSNHASYLDPLFLIDALPHDFLFVSKKELTNVPIFSTFLRKIGHLVVDRYSAREGVADTTRITRALEQGSSVLIFAEGTFTRARGLRPFKLGAFKAAAEAGCSILPVALRGTRSVLRDESWILRPGPVDVVIRPAIQPAAKDWPELIRLRDAAFREILAHCGEPPIEIVSAEIPGRA